LCNLSETEQDIPVSEGGDRWRLALWSGDASFGGSEELVAPPERPGEPSGVRLSGWNAALYLSE
jgi:hypothetical protein